MTQAAFVMSNVRMTRRVRRPTALPLHRLVAMALAALFLVGCDDGPPAPRSNGEQPQRLPTARLRVGDVPIVVEVADEAAEHRIGMMFRRRLGPDEAMLFVFAHEADREFWMKNTWVDLDLAYIAADGTIRQIERLTARSVEPVYSREPARYALETPAGWFAAHDIAEGTRVTIPAEVAEPR